MHFPQDTITVMKPTKSAYWMTMIILSYMIVFGILSAIVGSVSGLNANPILEPMLRGVLAVVGIYVAVRHIEKKSMVPPNVVTKVSVTVGLILFAFGALISFVGGGEAATQLMVLVVITTVIAASASYLFLKKVAA